MFDTTKFKEALIEYSTAYDSLLHNEKKGPSNNKSNNSNTQSRYHDESNYSSFGKKEWERYDSGPDIVS